MLWVYFPLHKILYLFFHLFDPAEKTLASICDCANLLFRTISQHIYQTKFILRMVNAHNNKPSLSNTSLACHNNCNHIFSDVQKCPNTGLCPLEESPKTWLAFAHCWLTKVRWHTGAWITPMVNVIIFELKWDLVKHTKIPSDGKQRQRWRRYGGGHRDWAAPLRCMFVFPTTAGIYCRHWQGHPRGGEWPSG